jgi:hypothetical protein
VSFFKSIIDGPYFKENGGANMSLGILEPEGVALPQQQRWLLGFIREVLTNDFARFSKIVLFDQERLDALVAESLPNRYSEMSDTAIIAVGRLTNAQYLLSGRLIMTGKEHFTLELSVVATETGESKAVYRAPAPLEDWYNARAIQTAFTDCISQMGVELTAAGKKAIADTQSPEIEARAALSRGIEADKAGSIVEALYYFYTASRTDTALTSAAKHLDTLAKTVSSGSFQGQTPDDTERQDAWKKLLTDFEMFYPEHAAFDVVYTETPALMGKDEATADFEVSLRLSRNITADAMQKTITLILEGLSGTPHQENNEELESWPAVPVRVLYGTKQALFSDTTKHQIVLGLYNDNHALISQAKVTIPAPLTLINGVVNAQSSPVLNIQFIGVAVTALTEQMTVHIITIDDKDAAQLQIDDLWKVIPSQKLPTAQPAIAGRGGA